MIIKKAHDWFAKSQTISVHPYHDRNQLRFSGIVELYNDIVPAMISCDDDEVMIASSRNTWIHSIMWDEGREFRDNMWEIMRNNTNAVILSPRENPTSVTARMIRDMVTYYIEHGIFEVCED